MTDNPWAPWGLIHTKRDGFPILSESALWHLLGAHPSTVERIGEAELYVHLDQPYQAISLGASWALVPAPGRHRPAPKVVAA